MSLIHPNRRLWVSGAEFRRRLAAGLLVGVLIVSAIACGQSAPVDAPKPSPTAPRSTEPTPTRRASAVADTPTAATRSDPPASRLGIEPQELSGVTIRLMHPLGGAAAATLEQLVRDFNATNEWDIEAVVEAVSGPDEMEARMASALEAGDPPDLTAGYLHQALRWDSERPLVTLQNYVDDPLWGFTADEQADFYPEFWSADVVDGRRVGLPFQRSAQVLFYNRSWARELGFTAPPLTPQQFADQVCAAAKMVESGGLLITPHYAAALGWVYSFGGEVVRSQPLPEQSNYRFNSPEAIEAFTFLRDLYDDRCAWAVEKLNVEEEFAGRRALIAPGSLADIPYAAEAVRRAGRGDEWTVIGFASPDAAPEVASYGPSLAIFITTPERQLAAWLLAKWLLEPGNHARLAEAGAAFPLRVSERNLFDAAGARLPQWAAALDLLPGVRAEPAHASWETVRWALSDAFTQLFRSYFTVDQLPAMLNYLDRTAAELQFGPDASIFNTPEPTATP